MNPLKNIDNLINHMPSRPKRVRDSRFLLLEKTADLDVATLEKSSGHVPDNAKTYNYISIGKNGDDKFKRDVITFKDDKNQVIRKIIAGTGLSPKIRDYEYNTFVKDGWNEFLERRNIKTRQVNPNKNVWETTAEEDQYVHVTTAKYKYQSGFAKKLHIEKNEYVNDNDQKKVIATITEYPYNLGFEPKSAKKVMGVEMSISHNRPHIEKITPNTNMELPKDDEFLPYRFLLGEQKQTCLTQNVLDRKGVGNLGVGIYYSKDVVPQNSEGMFNHLDGNIYYRGVSRQHPVKIAAHEGEHVYQYSLIARLGKLLSRFGIVCKTNMPAIEDIKEMDKGYKYVIASENYPKLTETEDLAKNKDYWNNALEEGARDASETLTKLYEKGRKVLSDIFPYSKSNTNF